MNNALIPDDHLRLERGTLRDYRALSAFHYRGGSAGAATTVYRLVHDAPTVVGRYLNRRGERRVVGALVRSLPHLACALRDDATGGRYRNLRQPERASLLNREVRTLTRIVVHPQWRGIGLAVRLVRHALGDPEPGVVYTEGLAAMGRVHPFLEKAGMIRYDRPPHPGDARLLEALRRLEIEPATLAAPSAVLAELHRRDECDQAFFEHELARWHRSGSRRRSRRIRADEPEPIDMLRAARERLLLVPVYHLHSHQQKSEHLTGTAYAEHSTESP